mgnify:CR=1 FL=1
MCGDEVSNPLGRAEPWFPTRAQIPNEIRVAQGRLPEGGRRCSGPIEEPVDLDQ